MYYNLPRRDKCDGMLSMDLMHFLCAKVLYEAWILQIPLFPYRRSKWKVLQMIHVYFNSGYLQEYVYVILF